MKDEDEIKKYIQIEKGKTKQKDGNNIMMCLIIS
jgi:hypothetical protein